MATEKTDFLRFNAYSMKELITRKMSEDSKFTDQIYEGSNLAILIDLVAYMYQVLVYQLNNAASESMFQDTQIYENISRLVKMIGYNPRGCKPSKLTLNIYRETEQNPEEAVLLKYSRIDTGLTDSRGQSICFSTPGGSSINQNGDIPLESENTRTIEVVNGRWKRYRKVFVASGMEYETFTLDDVGSDNQQNRFVAGDYIDVYIVHDGQIDSEWKQDSEELLLGTSKNDDNMESNANRLYMTTSKVYSVRLNENKFYEIKFGDGTTGQKLSPKDQIYVFYLETNGPDGEIDVGSVNFDNIKFTHDQSMFDLQKKEYDTIFSIENRKLLTDKANENTYSIQPYSLQTTSFKAEQDVEDIRNYAPQWFKTGNRLLTRSDYEFFVKTQIDQVIDVKCMNNWEYLATFYRWLYECGIKYHQDSENPGRYYFQENRFMNNSFDMVDAADANNIYIWVKTQDEMTLDRVRDMMTGANIDYMKIMTSEIQFLHPLNVMFDICACYQDVGQTFAKMNDFDTFVKKAVGDSYLEITLDDQCIYVNSYILSRVQSIFNKYFNILNLRLGQNINLSDILDEIYSIAGVIRVRTVFNPKDGSEYEYVEKDQCAPRAIDGISMISWTNGFIDYGEDVQIGNVSRHILDFQFPQFNGTLDMSSKIKIIKKQLSNMSNIKF